jgi:hypothetical protein
MSRDDETTRSDHSGASGADLLWFEMRFRCFTPEPDLFESRGDTARACAGSMFKVQGFEVRLERELRNIEKRCCALTLNNLGTVPTVPAHSTSSLPSVHSKFNLPCSRLDVGEGVIFFP